MVRANDVNRRLERLGAIKVSQRGSHRKYKASYKRVDGSTGTVQTIVAQHRGDMPQGTLRSIEESMEPAFGKGWLL